jgi:hypothetical protein
LSENTNIVETPGVSESTSTAKPNSTTAPTSTKTPITAKDLTVVFMGESITAPESYPDVPEAYKPVLDDLYILGKVVGRNSDLYLEGKSTQKSTSECDRIENEIYKRGHISGAFGVNEANSGYALVDLDSDKNPELLLLNYDTWDSFRKQNPCIYSIFTIRNGKLVSIVKDSYDLAADTFLAADGTFYKCIGSTDTGYATLSAFRLEPEMSDFTVVSELEAGLSFSGGDVPVPYWVDRENGKEINITEDEFNILSEKYYNLEDMMKLDFIQFNPNAIDYLHVQSSSEKPENPIDIDYPQIYKDAPIEYKQILDEFYLFSYRIQKGESLDESQAAAGFVEPPHGELSYAIADLNNDGIEELLLGTTDGLNNSNPDSIFTLRSGEPVKIANFWSRYRGVVSADGTIYTDGSGGAAYTSLSSLRLEVNADTLTQLTDIHSDYSVSAGKSYYVQVVDGKNRYITYEEFENFIKEYDNPSQIMKLAVIPITN